MKGYPLTCALLAGFFLPTVVLADTTLTEKIFSRTAISAKALHRAALFQLDQLEEKIAANVIFQKKLAEHVRTAHELNPHETMLPEEFKVYYKPGLGISRKVFKQGDEKIIPNKNHFAEKPGCYIACYSKHAHHGVLATDDNYHLVGQMRFEGHYANGICIPKGFESKDIRKAKEFKVKCEESFPEKCEKGSCDVHGLTSHWFY